MLDGLMPAEVLAAFAPEAVSPAILALIADNAPTRTILCAGAGSFEQAHITLTRGIHVGRGEDAAQRVLGAMAAMGAGGHDDTGQRGSAGATRACQGRPAGRCGGGPMSQREAVIVATARTPIGRAYRGSFNATPAPTLAAHAIRAAVERAGVAPAEIDDLIMGASLQQELRITVTGAIPLILRPGFRPSLAGNKLEAGALFHVGEPFRRSHRAVIPRGRRRVGDLGVIARVTVIPAKGPNGRSRARLPGADRWWDFSAKNRFIPGGSPITPPQVGEVHEA